MSRQGTPTSMIEDGDVSVFDLRDVILRLPTAQPITDDYESGVIRSVWYSSQQEHLAGWLSEYNSPGAYNRANPSTSSKHFYNHFRCAAGLIWLAEALGEDELLLKAGVEAIRSAGPNPSSQCAAFRRVVPWARIVELLGLRPQEILKGQPLGQKVKSFIWRARMRLSDDDRQVSRAGQD